MGMLNHDAKEVKIETKDKIDRKELGFGANPPKEETVTYSTTVRVNNHVSNELNTMVKLGFGKSIGDVIQILIDEKMDSASEDIKNKYNILLDMLEKQDYLTHG